MYKTTRRLETGNGSKFQSWFVFSFLFLVNVFQSKQELTHVLNEEPSSHYLRDEMLLVENDGPTTLGDFTTFTARIQHSQRPSYNLCWIIPIEKFLHCMNTSNNKSTLLYGNWKSSGEKKVIVCVTNHRFYEGFYEQKKPYEIFHWHCAIRNTTTVLVTDTINLDLDVWQSSHEPKKATKSFFVGKVQMQAIIHGHLFNGTDVRYMWNFGDGKTIATNFSTQSHVYREDKTYLLSVTAWSFAKGKLYNGSATIRLIFKVILDAHLVAYGRPGFKLIPRTKPMADTYYLASGSVTFVVKYNDLFSLVKSVSTDWKIDGYQKQKWPSNEFTYDVSRLGLHTMWATYRFHTEHHIYSGSQSINLIIKEPILSLNVSHASTLTIPKQTPATFHITCRGSFPFSFCWFITKNCKLLNTSSCIPTIESNRCHTTVNHTFSNPGTYCLNVSVFNTVSSAGTLLNITIPEGHYLPSKTPGTTAAAVLVPLFLSTFIIAGLVYLVKSYVAQSKRTVEKADFDFRDEDIRSVSSVDLATKFTSCYHVFDPCSRKKSKRDVLLMDRRGKQYGSVYNEL